MDCRNKWRRILFLSRRGDRRIKPGRQRRGRPIRQGNAQRLAGLGEGKAVEFAEELDIIAGFSTRPAPVRPFAFHFRRPDVEAVVSATPWARTLPFSAMRGRNFFQLHFFLCQIKDVHVFFKPSLFSAFSFFPFFFYLFIFIILIQI